MNILLIGDIVGTQGCDFLRSVLPGFKKFKAIDVVIANGEISSQVVFRPLVRLDR